MTKLCITMIHASQYQTKPPKPTHPTIAKSSLKPVSCVGQKAVATATTCCSRGPVNYRPLYRAPAPRVPPRHCSAYLPGESGKIYCPKPRMKRNYGSLRYLAGRI